MMFASVNIGSLCWICLELKYRVEKISKIKRVEDELFLLIFSTRSLTNL